MERKTPLYDRHTAAGGKLVPFAGWLLPVQYSGVIAEHRAVRTGCGLFDVSHMGELLLRGPDALANLNRLMTNDFSGMADGQARYSPMCYEDGGVVDDLIVYRCSDTAWLAVVNASNIGKDRDWMTAHLAGDCTLEDLSDQTAQLALQGPGAGDQAGPAVHRAVEHGGVVLRRKVRRQGAQQRLRTGPLEGELGRLVGEILQSAVPGQVGGHPIPVLAGVGGVDHRQPGRV